MKSIFAILIFTLSAFTKNSFAAYDAQELQADLARIQIGAKWQTVLNLEILESTYPQNNSVTINCSASGITVSVASSVEEVASTLYHGLFKMGFLFPHPRWQISPTLESAREQCGKTFIWKPAFQHRGFHLHTLHPNEWVNGFLQGDNEIAFDTIRWLARNRQNAIDVNILRGNLKEEIASINTAFLYAKKFSIMRGISNGAALQQQNSWKMIPLWRSITGIGDKAALLNSVRTLGANLDYDFLSMEFGTSEFTSVNYERALSWMNLVSDEMELEKKKLFAKLHVSTNQVSKKWGNFNFLAVHAKEKIGLFPHTVHFYGLYDDQVPMYGNHDFHHMLKLIQEQKSKREIWYYPETSYWISMDVDVPLLLTDYLKARALDMKNLHHEGISGHFTFTSGQELGYWLFDWTVALLADQDLQFDPLAGLKLLNEDQEAWDKILSFQNKHFKQNQLIQILSVPNLQDDISKHRIHDRHTLKEVAHSKKIREEEISKLELALSELPSVDAIKNLELKGLLQVTHLRIQHALAVRKALRGKIRSQERTNSLQEAKSFRKEALNKIQNIKDQYERYPTAKVFDLHASPTSYQFGYLWPAATLCLWEKEEARVKNGRYGPFYKNIYNFLDIIF